jgi:hypothetical protein
MRGNAQREAAETGAQGVNADARLQARQIRRLAREYRGAATAGYAASGIDVSGGTPLVAEHEITQRSEEDALFTILGAKNRATSLRRQGKAAQTAGNLEAASTILGAAGSYGSGGWQKAAGGAYGAGSAFNSSGGLKSSVITGTQLTPGAYA